MSVIKLNETNTICLTGKSVYRYIELNEELKDKDDKLTAKHTGLDVFGGKAQHVTDNYTCHCWIKDTARVIVCTEEGDILLTDYEGRFLAYIAGLNDVIECIQPISFGFVVGGKAKILLFKETDKSQTYYKQIKTISDPSAWDKDNVMNLCIS